MCLRSALCLVSVCLRVGMFVLLCFLFFFFFPIFGAGWWCCEIAAGAYSNINACVSFPFFAQRRVGFDVSDDGAVWKTVSVRVLERQKGRNYLE